MRNDDLRKLVEEAISSTDIFVEVLAAEGLTSWVGRFSTIACYLRQGDARGAIHTFGNCSYTVPGSLSDIFAKDQRAFDSAWAECARNLRSLNRAAVIHRDAS